MSPQSPSFLGHVVGKRGRLQIKPSGSGDENAFKLINKYVMNEQTPKQQPENFFLEHFYSKTQKFILKRQNPSQIGVHFVIFFSADDKLCKMFVEHFYIHKFP